MAIVEPLPAPYRVDFFADAAAALARSGTLRRRGLGRDGGEPLRSDWVYSRLAQVMAADGRLEAVRLFLLRIEDEPNRLFVALKSAEILARSPEPRAALLLQAEFGDPEVSDSLRGNVALGLAEISALETAFSQNDALAVEGDAVDRLMQMATNPARKGDLCGAYRAASRIPYPYPSALTLAHMSDRALL